MSKKRKTIIEYRHYNLPMAFPVLLLSGERWRISEVKSGRLHFHNCLEIGLCHSDSGIMEFEEKKEHFQAGDVTCVPRHRPHTTYSSPDAHSLWSYIFFDPDVLFNHLFRNSNANFEKLTSQPHFFQHIFPKNTYPILNHLTTMVVNEMVDQKPYYKEKVHGLLMALYIELLRIYSDQSDAKTITTSQSQEQALIIAPALNHIYGQYMNKITIDALATLCHLSTTHFRRVFHEIMGATPLAFLNSLRIDESCRLLKTTEASILSIAEQVGFSSISSYNRTFAKLLNTSPTKWRKNSSAQQNSHGTSSILEFIGWL